MDEDGTLATLAEKRAEIAREIGEAEAHLRWLRDGLEHLDATARMLSPGGDSAVVQPRRRGGGLAINVSVLKMSAGNLAMK